MTSTCVRGRERATSRDQCRRGGDAACLLAVDEVEERRSSDARVEEVAAEPFEEHVALDADHPPAVVDGAAGCRRR